jgi:hypothetical protein
VKEHTRLVEISFTDASGIHQAIEVKGTVLSQMKGFLMTESERRAARKLRSRYTITIVVDVAGNPRFAELIDPIGKNEEGLIAFDPVLWSIEELRVRA